MKEGRITQAGKNNDILNSGTDFMELVGAHKKALSALDSTEAGLVSRSISTSKEIGNVVVVQKQENEDTQNAKVDDKVLSKGQIIQEEEREKGKVGFSVYWKYITMVYGGTLVPFILLAQVLFQLLQIGSNYWIVWATPVSQGMKPDVGSSTLMIVYVSLAIGSSFFILVRTMLVATAGFMAANQLFNKMHLSIFRSPMSFFDATPSGRILNRVSVNNVYGAPFFSIVFNFISLFNLSSSSLSLSLSLTLSHTHTHSFFQINTMGYRNFLN